MTKEEKAALAEKNKEILAAWKAEKEAARQAKKDARALKKARLKARPFWQKLLSFCGKLAAVVLVLVLIFKFFGLSLVTGVIGLMKPAIAETMMTAGYQEKDTADERARIPADEEAQQKIADMAGSSREDTWAVYLYIVGADLESRNQNDLSAWIRYQVSSAKQANKAANNARMVAALNTYMDTIEAAGLELPSPMYAIDAPSEASSVPVTNDVVVATLPGSASMDLDEILKVALPENIEFVIETGGATRWSNARINPNRVQTFCYNSNGLNEERNVPTHSMSTVDSLTDFLQYCETNHDADHKVLILWDHGAGAFGYGVDELFGDQLSLKQIGEALGNVYTADPEKPPFELIGFDACLMASAEVMDMLDGYGRYFAGSEESEPGFGWFYTDWMEQLVANPGMNGAQLALAIADSYMDFYARQSRNVFSSFGLPVGKNDVLTFSVLDIHKGAQVYDAYVALMEEALRQTAKDDSVLTGICQAAKNAIHYGEKAYYVFNTLDLGTFLEHMPASLSEQAQKAADALADSVLYVRSASALEGSQGLSIYFPDLSGNQNSIIYMMNYINDICDSDAVDALYFYKTAGCLTEDMLAALEEQGIEAPQTLDLTALQSVISEPLTIDADGGYTVQISDEACRKMTGIGLAVGRVEDGKVIYYGVSADAELSGGALTTDFAGKWICLNGEPLSVEVVFDTDRSTTYHSSILLGGTEATLVFACDKASGEFTILGAYNDSSAIAGDFIGRNVSDLDVGDKITPVYRCTDLQTLAESTLQGNPVTYRGRTSITLETLKDGDYLTMITFDSIRGDEFCTATAEMKISSGKPSLAPAEGYAVVNNH